MNSFTAVFLLGLLALGHATPLTTVTQVPRTDEDFFRDAVTDGFLVDQNLLTSLTTTQAPREETTPLVTTTTQERPTAAGEESAAVDHGTTAEPEEGAEAEGEDGVPDEEGSAMGSVGRVLRHSENDGTTTVEPLQSASMTTPPPQHEDQSTTEPSAERAITEVSLKNMFEEGSGDETTTAATTTTEKTSIAFPSLFPENEGSGEPLTTTISGEIHKGRGMILMESSQDESTTTMTPLTPKAPERVEAVTEMPKGHVTPDWVIILGFLVGIAVLVLLCVAIATRDKWNGPNQFNQTGVTDQLVEEEKALEMETFIHNELPKENGKAEEYTVIPLDELPDSYSS